MKTYYVSKFKRRQILTLMIISSGLYCCITLLFIKRSLVTSQLSNAYQVIVLCTTNHLILDKTDVILMDKLERLVKSIAKKSPRTRININIIAYEEEVVQFKEAIESATEGSETITYTFVSLNEITRNFERQITLSRNYTTFGKNHRYYDVTLHIRAHYPKIFTYNKAVVLDLDMEFKCSFQELYEQFYNMNTSQIFAFAHDQAPWYRHAFKQYRKENRGTKIGEPPPMFPGFNAGLILFDLEKMRKSEEFNYRLTDTGYISLFEKYHVNSGVGDQDFFTLLGAEYPDIYYVLDCSFNRQVGSLRFMNPVFEAYYKCDDDVKIFHFNNQMNYLY
ncbi:uncharacterized protein LOC136031624 [Artemia franciscana]|uniref:uncharacterized protein LOC136031624 n=1 Tax=Artemia franciscana TaxID=6661 RepID=UPI0032DA5787